MDRYFWHPLISLCARMEKKQQTPELATLPNYRVQNFCEFRGGKFGTPPFFLAWQVLDSAIFFRVASSGLCHLRGWPVQDFIHFFVLAHKGVARIAVHPVVDLSICQNCSLVKLTLPQNTPSHSILGCSIPNTSTEFGYGRTNTGCL